MAAFVPMDESQPRFGLTCQIEVERLQLSLEFRAAGVGARVRIMTQADAEACRASVVE